MANYERYQGKETIGDPRVVNADNRIVPSLRKGETFPMTVAHFPDHGRPCFVGSAIKSHPLFLGLARELTPDESKKANDRFRAEIERILDGDETRRVGTMSVKDNSKPDINRVFIGEPYDPKGLRLYYTRSEFMGTPAIYLLAICKSRDSARVERIFEDAGYRGTKNWEKRKVH